MLHPLPAMGHTLLLLRDTRASVGTQGEQGFTPHPLPELLRLPQEILFWVNEPHQTLKSDSS